MKNKGTQFLTEAAVIGAIYVVLTLFIRTTQLWRNSDSLFGSTDHPAILYTGCDSGVICGMYHCQSLWRCHSCRHYFRKHRNTDRSSIYLQTPQLQPFSCADPADCFQCSHRAIRTSLRIRSKSSDSAYDAYRRYRRSSFLWCSRTDSSDSPSEIQKCDLQITENCITYDI